MPARLLRVVLRVAATILVAALIWIVIVPQFGEAQLALSEIGLISPALLALGVLLEAASTAAWAMTTSSTIPVEVRPRYRTVLRAVLVGTGVTNTLPAGGAVSVGVRLRILNRAGVPVGTMTGAIVAGGMISFLLVAAIFSVGLALLPRTHALGPDIEWAGFVALGVTAACAIGLTLVVVLRDRVARLVAFLLRRLPKRAGERASAFVFSAFQGVADVAQDRRLLPATVWAAANWVFDAAALWVLLAAFGQPLSLPVILAVYGLGGMLTNFPFTPGGLGIVEGVLVPALVDLGVEPGVAVLGVTAWRLVQFWLPIPVAGVAALLGFVPTRGGRRDAPDSRAQAGNQTAP